jgi:hypothetical protein
MLSHDLRDPRAVGLEREELTYKGRVRAALDLVFVFALYVVVLCFCS